MTIARRIAPLAALALLMSGGAAHADSNTLKSSPPAGTPLVQNVLVNNETVDDTSKGGSDKGRRIIDCEGYTPAA